MSLPANTLQFVLTGTGYSPVGFFENLPTEKIQWTAHVSGSTGSNAVHLEGSLDGENWGQISVETALPIGEVLPAFPYVRANVTTLNADSVIISVRPTGRPKGDGFPIYS